MNLSMSTTSTFSNIDWETFENRPVIDSSMPFCSSFNWEYDVPCCTDGSVISDALEMAKLQKKESTPEAKFLSEYPCLNSYEYEDISSGFVMEYSEFLDAKKQNYRYFISKIIRGLKKLFS
jgi:hypothetical protein